MKESTLPSGLKIKSFLSKSTKPVADKAIESTSGAMVLDVPGICPKCNKQMGIALVGTEQVFYCTNDRVTLPLPITE